MTYKDIICDANNLYKAYLASVKASKWKPTTQKVILCFLSYISDLLDKLLNQTLENGITNEFFVNERGKIRPITGLTTPDRMVRHVLCDEVLLPKVRKKIIYDNCASLKGRGIDQQRKRFEIHLKRYYKEHKNSGWAILGDFSKFYDNIIHELAKHDLLELVDFDEFVDWLLTLIFKGFEIDVSYMTDEEYDQAFNGVFNKLVYRSVPKDILTGQRFMPKSVNIGDQLSQVIGIYFPTPVDQYAKTVRSSKYYGRYSDDWYLFDNDYDRIIDIFNGIKKKAESKGIHINDKKTRIVKMSSKITFLQVYYWLLDNGKIVKKMKPKKITNFRRKLRKLSVKVKNGETTYENVESMFKSWMGSFYKLMSRSQRKGLLELFEELFDKKIEIIKKKNNKNKMVITDRT